MMLRMFFLLVFCALSSPCLGAVWTQGPLSVSVPDAVGEGQPFVAEVTLAGQAQSVRMEWMGKSVDVTMAPRGNAYAGMQLMGAGLGCAHEGQPLVVEAVHGGKRDVVRAIIQAVPTVFPEQRLTLPKQMVTPSKENQERIKRERVIINQALSALSPQRLWTFPFLRPVPGEVTSAFGLRRILNGQPKNSHTGIDFDAFMSDPVLAANQGRVLLTGDFYYNGRSVFIDHGQGVITMYFHLSEIGVETGQQVARGQEVGKIGSTGRSTGPHLHFGMKLQGQSVDPMPLFTVGGIFDGQGGS